MDELLEHTSQLRLLSGLLTKQMIIAWQPKKLGQLGVRAMRLPLLLRDLIRRLSRTSRPGAVGSSVALLDPAKFHHLKRSNQV